MAKHLAKKAACLIGSAAVALSMTLGAFPVYANSAASAPELGPVTSKDVVYQIITDRFYDGDTSNNVPAGFDATLYDGTGQDLKLYQGGDWAGIIEKIPYLKGMGTVIRRSSTTKAMAVSTGGRVSTATMFATILRQTSISER